MNQVHLSDQLYQEAQRRAAEAGFPSVDDYVADVLQHEIHDESENFDHLFTAQRLAHINRAAAEIDGGKGLTLEQVDAAIAKRRAEWLRQNSR